MLFLRWLFSYSLDLNTINVHPQFSTENDQIVQIDLIYNGRNSYQMIIVDTYSSLKIGLLKVDRTERRFVQSRLTMGTYV